MAKLKCWNKETSEQQLSWFNKSNKGFVTISNRFESIDPKIRKNKWNLYIEDSKGHRITKNVKPNKTKIQSLRFARQYMKKHDKC